MAKEQPMNPYANLQLRRQIYLEARAMAEFALSKGRTVPAQVITTIEAFEDEAEPAPAAANEGPDAPAAPAKQPIDNLVQAHDELVALVAPATPKTILLLDMEQERNHFFKFLGPVGLVRQMMMLAILSLVLFIALSLSPSVDSTELSAKGLPGLMDMLFFLAAAGLGASFASLYKANDYITRGTFDPTQQASYWIRFLLGLIAGLVMAIFISDKSLEGSSFLNEGIVRPLLAILGGFSADLVYTLLNRLVETMKSLFQGSMKNLIETKAEEARAQAEGQTVHNRMKLAADLLKVQQEMGSNPDPGQVQAKLNEMLTNLMPEGNARKQ